MKILILDNSMYPTGAFVSLKQIVQDLNDRFQFVVVFPTGSECTSIMRNIGIDSRELPFQEIRKSLTALKYFRRLKKNARTITDWIRQDEIDLIHVNDIYNMLGVELKKQGGHLPLVQHVRLLKNSYIKPLYPFFARRVFRKADAIVAVSQSVYDDLPESYKKILIYNGFHHSEKYQAAQISNKVKIKIGCFGRFMAGKGQLMVLKAFRAALSQNTHLSITFVGGESNQSVYAQELGDYVAKYGLTNSVSFEDFTTDVEKEMKAYDIIINFSVSESFSRVCLEALSYGIPLISSDSGGPSELFEDGKSGRLVENKNVEELSRAILELSGNSELRKQFSEEGKKYVRNKFSKENTSEKLALLYQNLLKK